MLMIIARIPIKDNGVQGEIMGKIQVRFKKFIAIAIVLNVAVGMALSVVSLFAEVSKSNAIMVDAAQLGHKLSIRMHLDGNLRQRPLLTVARWMN